MPKNSVLRFSKGKKKPFYRTVAHGHWNSAGRGDFIRKTVHNQYFYQRKLFNVPFPDPLQQSENLRATTEIEQNTSSKANHVPNCRDSNHIWFSNFHFPRTKSQELQLCLHPLCWSWLSVYLTRSTHGRFLHLSTPGPCGGGLGGRDGHWRGVGFCRRWRSRWAAWRRAAGPSHTGGTSSVSRPANRNSSNHTILCRLLEF